jgi:hypothetical protein
MPRSPCLEAGCPNFATARGRCDEHRRELERERSRRRRAERGPRVYGTKKWQMTRMRKLAQDPICEACETELAAEVDHIVPLDPGGDPYAFENLSAAPAAVTANKPLLRTRGSAASPTRPAGRSGGKPAAKRTPGRRRPRRRPTQPLPTMGHLSGGSFMPKRDLAIRRSSK